jgi:leucyl-tRNA synthetase
MSEGSYKFREIEQRWREYWIENKTFRTPSKGDPSFDPDKPKYYVLDMFPYTSGSGLHIGHPKGYIASDIYSRYKRMQGFNVLHPMGFDSFGLPAEQYARLHNVHPAEVTEQNVDIFRRQFQILGMDYDWDREISTSRPNFYRWTQWIFLQLFESWFNPDFDWRDSGGRQIRGRARPIAELADSFERGERALSSEDQEIVGDGVAQWSTMSTAQRALVLNNYRLAFQKEVSVNWCPVLGTVLANEEVTNEGKSEVGDHPVYRRPLKQWVLRITAYADRLLEDLDSKALPDAAGNTFALDWPDPIKLMQRNWIGRSAGGEVQFELSATADSATADSATADSGTPNSGTPNSATPIQAITVFTTRPDTLFGATFMVIAPEHPLVLDSGDAYLIPDKWPDGTPTQWKGERPDLSIREAVAAYAAKAMGKSARQQREEREKTGIYAGFGARNPANGQILPVFVADYVSMDYGTGAIMAVPAHDERDGEFARNYRLPIVEVVQTPEGFDGDCFSGEGTAINSPATGDSPYAINGLSTIDAIAHITQALAAQGKGRGAVSYKLRDWVFSRQWYWGEPFPLATHPDGYVVQTETPVILPQMDDFKPETSDDPESPVLPPLSRAGDGWLNLEVEGIQLRREVNVMPQWAGSCWYFLRFIDPHNDDEFCGADLERFFMPVDLYIGGAEHAVLHLLYSRFWHKVLFDLDLVSCPEPFKRLFNQGMITADAFTDDRGAYVDIREVEIRNGDPYHTKTGEKLQRFAGKMGKRYKNGLPPEEVGDEYGIDTLRLYEMYMGPLEASAPWSMEGIRGMQRFLSRVWRNLIAQDGTAKIGGEATPELLKSLHKTIAKVSADLEGLRFNTAIAALIEFNNEIVSLSTLPSPVARDFLRLLVPLAPHLAEEVWRLCGYGDGDLSLQEWPVADEKFLKEETVVLPIQVNGKVRASVEVSVDLGEEELRHHVLELENVKRHLPASADSIKRFIIVPGKIINIVC